MKEVTVEIEGKKPEIDASDEKLDEIKDGIQEAKNKPLEKQIDAVEDIVEKYSLDDIAKAIVSDGDNSPVARLLMNYLSDDEPEPFSVSTDDVQEVIEAVENGDINALCTKLNMIADMGAGTPAVSIVKGWNSADQNHKALKKFKKFAKGIELDGDIGYKFSDDDDDISFYDSDDYKNSKYGKIFGELAEKGITTLDQYELMGDKIKAMLNEGLIPAKETIKVAGIKIPSTVKSGDSPISKSVSELSPEEIKIMVTKMKEAGDNAGIDKLKKQLMGIED